MSFGPSFSSPETRVDRPQIEAVDLAQCRYIPIVAGGAAAYPAGQVMARLTADDTYEAYNGGGAGGLEIAVGVLVDDVDASAADVPARLLYIGTVYQAKLTGLDAGGITDMGARSITNARGEALLVI